MKRSTGLFAAGLGLFVALGAFAGEGLNPQFLK